MTDLADGELMMRWTVRVAVALYFCRIWLLVTHQKAFRAVPSMLDCWLWTTACVAYLAHVGLAFHFVHHWSHDKAWLHTAAETQRLIGLHRGEGLWVNYFFTVLWCLDVIRLWLARRGNKMVGSTTSLIWHLFVAFTVFNATVVFGPPMYRWLLIPAGLALSVAISSRKNRSAAP